MLNVTFVDMYGMSGALKKICGDGSIEGIEGVVETDNGLLLVKTRFCVASDIDRNLNPGTTTATLIPIFTHNNQDLSVKWANAPLRMTEYMNIREAGN